MENKILMENVFVYTFYNGILKKYFGNLCIDSKESLHGHFVTCQPYKPYIKDMVCSAYPEEIYNSLLWIPEENDELANKLFLVHEYERISELTKEIYTHRKNICTLLGTHF